MTNLNNRKIAVLATDGVEEIELTAPVKALKEAGAEVFVVSPKSGSIQGMNHDKPGDPIEVDMELDQADARNFDALVLPGGVANPDTLRMTRGAVSFVESFVAADKPIAAICHGPWTLINAGAIDGRKMTSWPSLEADLRNAGADWVDEEVVVCTDGPNALVTSRRPDDLPAFCRTLVEVIAEQSAPLRATV